MNASAGLDPPPGQRGDGAAERAPSSAAAAARPGQPSVSGSRRLDLLAFLLLACLVVGSSYWRLRVYHRETEPLVDHYEQQGRLRRIDGARDPDSVHADVRAALDHA